MKIISVSQVCALSAGLLLTLFSAAAIADDGPWIHDLDAAFAKAAETGKPVMAEFTGSDWCPPCQMMNERVFSQQEFLDKASEKFILAKVDMPRGDEAVREANEPHVRKHEVRGFPTIILFDSEGKEFSRFVATAHPNVEAFLGHLENELAKKDMQ